MPADIAEKLEAAKRRKSKPDTGFSSLFYFFLNIVKILIILLIIKLNFNLTLFMICKCL